MFDNPAFVQHKCFTTITIQLLLLLFIFFSIFYHSTSIHHIFKRDDIALIRQRVLETAFWPPQNEISNIVELAISYNEIMNSSCYWEDINYRDTTPAVWATEEHLFRINYMLQALTVPGSSVRNDPQLEQGIHCALNVWLINNWTNPNNWFQDIGTPLVLTGQLVMLGDKATTFETKRITQISYLADWWARDVGTGANLVWMLQIELYRSIATRNRTGLQESFARLWKDVVVQPLGQQGVQTDWSYQFHGSQLYSAGYGQDWAVGIIVFVLSAKDTQYQPAQGQLVTFANFLTQGNAWMINDNIWDWQVQGRTFDRPGTVFASLEFQIQPHSMRSFANLIQSNYSLKQDLINFADRMDKQPDAVPLLGNKHFYTSDYQTHRRLNWTSTIRIQSPRTQPPECMNGENLKGEHLGQGVLNVYTNNASDYLKIFPLFDWQAINGITVEHDIPLRTCRDGFAYIQMSFAGGVSDGNYGSTAMDTATHNLTAKRSWHFYDEAIVALASNLTLLTPTTAWTTLASRLVPKGIITVGFFNGKTMSLSDGTNYSFPYTTANKSQNVQWIHIGGCNIGYLLQTQGLYAAIGAEISTKTASYKTIGPYNDTVTGRIGTVWIDHGVGPYTRNYSYMVVPNVNVQSMRDVIRRYAREKIFSCLSNNDHFHGVVWPSLERASFVLWDSTATTFSCQSSSFKLTVRLENDGLYLFSETVSDFSVTVSHPTRLRGAVSITVDRVGFGEGCSASSNSTTDVTVVLPSTRQYQGKSVTVTCKKRKN